MFERVAEETAGGCMQITFFFSRESHRYRTRKPSCEPRCRSQWALVHGSVHSPDCSVGTFRFDGGDIWKRSALLQRHGRGVWAARAPKTAARGVDNANLDQWRMQILIRGKWSCALRHNSRALDVRLLPGWPPRVFDAEPKEIGRGLDVWAAA